MTKNCIVFIKLISKIVGILLFLSGCSDKKPISKQISPPTQKTKSISFPPIPDEIKDFSFLKISEIYQYLSIERWNNKGDIGSRYGTNYEKAAEALEIPVSKLKAADCYIHYNVVDSSRLMLKLLFENNNNIKPDYYRPVDATAWCGLFTFLGEIIVFGQKKDSDLVSKANLIVTELKDQLPDYITGFKINRVQYKDTILETEGDLSIGYIWRRGDKIEQRNSSYGVYGIVFPEENTHWHTSNWNNQNRIQHDLQRN